MCFSQKMRNRFGCFIVYQDTKLIKKLQAIGALWGQKRPLYVVMKGQQLA